MVAFRNGRPVTTPVTTTGMKGWAAYAQGRLLAENPFPRRDGGHDHAPATL
ncbi:hypothetical protein [Kitasatospora sp. NPDC094011]|uniref:hypothetical protein n=1 Tax=Kitasatospora sp. NPDC094011 TaxID=3364090 RepID=UPI00381D6BCF